MSFPFLERYRPERRSGTDRRSRPRPADPTAAASAAAGREPGEPAFISREESSPRRTNPDRRTEQRHPVPLNAGSVSGALTLADGSQWRASLWNISGSGACAVVAGDFEVTPGQAGSLSLSEDLGSGSIELTVEVRWGDSWVRRTFVGLELANGDSLDGGSFLDDYMNQGWAG